MFVATVELKADIRYECWTIDSGAGSHMTLERSITQGYKKLDKPEIVDQLGDGRTVRALGVGMDQIKSQVSGKQIITE